MKLDVKHLWKTKKKWIIGITAGAAAVAVGCSVWYYAGHNSKDPVYVYPFQYIGMTEFWGDSQESHGPVTTDKIQTVFLSDTQNVTEVFVQQGDTVKKGDLLMTFDTTLSDLQLERKRLSVEKLKLQLEDAKDELKRINSMKPMVVPQIPDSPEEEPSVGDPIEEKLYPDIADIVNRSKYDGSSANKALIYWIKNETGINDNLFKAAEEHAAKIQEMNKPEDTEPDDGEEPEGGDDTGTGDGDNTGNNGETGNGDGTDDGDNTGNGENTGSDGDIGNGNGTDGGDDTGNDTGTGDGTGDGDSTGDEDDTDNNENTEDGQHSNASAVIPSELPDGSSFYVVLKTTAGNTDLGDTKVWQCLKIKKGGNSYSFQFADTLISDYSVQTASDSDSGAADTPDQDFGSGYTAAQIAQMRSDKQKEIKDLDLKVKMADAEYKIMLREVGDGNIYAENDGKVVSLLSQEEARSSQQPILKVSGGGGFYVEGFISELEKDKMKPGQEVTVNDWNTGMTYTGTVESIGDFPSRNGYYNGSGNPNASYYPFLVFVDESADLQSGSYVSVQYSSAESQHGIYLENPFLRTEKGRSYVLVMGANGKLEQRWVTTGKSLWGSYTEILEGLSAEDRIAFPYGKNVKPGVAAQEGDLSNLYG